MKNESVSNFLNSIINQKNRFKNRNKKIEKKIKEKFFPLNAKFSVENKNLLKLSLKNRSLNFFKKRRVLYKDDKIRISFTIL